MEYIGSYYIINGSFIQNIMNKDIKPLDVYGSKRLWNYYIWPTRFDFVNDDFFDLDEWGRQFDIAQNRLEIMIHQITLSHEQVEFLQPEGYAYDWFASYMTSNSDRARPFPIERTCPPPSLNKRTPKKLELKDRAGSSVMFQVSFHGSEKVFSLKAVLVGCLRDAGLQPIIVIMLPEEKLPSFVIEPKQEKNAIATSTEKETYVREKSRYKVMFRKLLHKVTSIMGRIKSSIAQIKVDKMTSPKKEFGLSESNQPIPIARTCPPPKSRKAKRSRK